MKKISFKTISFFNLFSILSVFPLGAGALLLAGLPGCANFADSMAPKDYSRPWVPKKNQLGKEMPRWKTTTQAPVVPELTNGKPQEKKGAGKNAGKEADENEVRYSFLSEKAAQKKKKLDRKNKNQTGDGQLPSLLEAAQNAQKAAAPGIDISPEKNYALMDLIDIAQSANPATKQAWNMAKNAALDMGIARATYLPQITGSVIGGYWEDHWNANYKTHIPAQNIPIGGQGINIPGQDASVHGKMHIGGTTQSEVATMTWLLFDYGREGTIKAARNMALAANVAFTGVHQRVIFNVTQAYYLYAAAKRHLTLAQQAFENTREINRAVQARLKYGQATVVDAAQSRSAEATANMEVVKARGAVSDAYYGLIEAMGLNPQTHLSVMEEEMGELTLKDIEMTEEIVSTAVARRPDVVVAMQQLKASKAGIQKAIGDFVPKIYASGIASYADNGLGLSLSGGGQRSPTIDIGSQNFLGGIMGGVTVPIFDGGMRLARLKEAKNNAKNAEENLRQIENAAIREVVSAQNGLRTGLATWRASQKMQAAATTGFNAGLEAYRSGEGSLTRLLDLQNQLYKAERGKTDAYYGSLISAASLAFATGSLGSARDAQASRLNPIGGSFE